MGLPPAQAHQDKAGCRGKRQDVDIHAYPKEVQLQNRYQCSSTNLCYTTPTAASH